MLEPAYSKGDISHFATNEFVDVWENVRRFRTGGIIPMTSYSESRLRRRVVANRLTAKVTQFHLKLGSLELIIKLIMLI